MKLYFVEYAGMEGDQFDGCFYGASLDDAAADTDYWKLELTLEPGDLARLWEATVPETVNPAPWLLHGSINQEYSDGYEAMTALRSVRGFVAALVWEWYPCGEAEGDSDE